MTVLVQSVLRWGPTLQGPVKASNSGVTKRGGALVALAVVALLTPGGLPTALDALSEAYLAVSVFVAGTLALVYTAERVFRTDIGHWLERYRRWQVPVAALLGAFPGCGGAIVAVTQYTRGYLSFGGVVATLTATMGDAMFLLLAREPQTGVAILLLGIIVGVITGYAVDFLHGSSFREPKLERQGGGAIGSGSPTRGLAPVEKIWLVLVVPGSVMGLLGAFQLDVDAKLAPWTSVEIQPVFWLGVAGAALAVAMWVRHGGDLQTSTADQRKCGSRQDSVGSIVIHNTNFVTAWVVFAFVGYELAVAIMGIDLGRVFSVWGPLIPAIAVLIGFIPGCGPQIVVTSLYLSGAVPLSAQLGNAIANDGDALFPAIAVAPKAAVVATLYSAVPALIVAYGWHAWAEV